MRVLVVKTTSLGDVIHTLPALTDASRALPTIRFDWVVETPFAEIPRWHPFVDRIIPLTLRQWRRHPFQAIKKKECQKFFHTLRQHSYDVVIDAQGLIKSALITRLSRGFRCGLDWNSAWEPLASLAYQRKITVNPHQHAVTRVRELFARTLNYSMPTSQPDYYVNRTLLPTLPIKDNYIVFLHGTTWDTKHWPESYWIALAEHASASGLNVLIPWGNFEEKARAERIARASSNVQVLPKLNLAEIASVLVNAKAVASVDTGLGHLAAALAVPTFSLYGPTDAALTGTFGARQFHFQAQFNCSPCFSKKCLYTGESVVKPACFGTISPESVWRQIDSHLKGASNN